MKKFTAKEFKYPLKYCYHKIFTVMVRKSLTRSRAIGHCTEKVGPF